MLCKLTKCCICLPLRSGLLVFGYIQLVALYINTVTILCHMSDVLRGLSYSTPMNYILLSLAFGVSAVQFFFGIILVMGLHKNSMQLLQAYYECNVCLFITQGVIGGLYIPLYAYRSYPTETTGIWVATIALMIILGVIIIASQFYLISLVKSQLRTMKDEDEVVEV